MKEINKILTRKAIVELLKIIGPGSSEGYALACSDIAAIIENNIELFPDINI